MSRNLATINTAYTDSKINNSYLRSSYLNDTCPYIKGKNFESIFGGNRIINMDSYLNKYYASHMKKQDDIRQEKRIIDLIDKLDNNKVFNTLKEDYLREKAKMTHGYYPSKNEKRKDYFNSLINLQNYKDRLLTQNRSNNPEGEFLYSLMNSLGCRPKKVVIKKINKKIELLSKFKSFSKRKKQLALLNSKNPKRRGSLQMLLGSDEPNILSRNENFINYYNNTSFGKNSSKKSNNNYNLKNYTKKPTLELNEIDSIKRYSHNNNVFYQTNSTNFGMTNYNNFYNQKDNIGGDDNKNNNKNNFNNLKIEEINVEHSINNSLSEFNLVNDENYKKRNSLSRKDTSSKKTTKKFSSKKLIKQLSSKNKNLHINIENGNNIKGKNNTNNNNYNTINNNILKLNLSKKNKEILNSSNSSEQISEELKLIDLKIIKDKLYKKHLKIKKKFLQKIKTEEMNIKESSDKLSNSLYLVKKLHQKFLCENDNPNKKNKTQYNFYSSRRGVLDKIENKKIKNEKNKKKLIKIGKFDFLGKSKYKLPEVNKKIYGSIENTKDTFEILQNELHNEVKRQIEKRGNSKKLKINGREIIDKLRLKNKTQSNNLLLKKNKHF